MQIKIVTFLLASTLSAAVLLFAAGAPSAWADGAPTFSDRACAALLGNPSFRDRASRDCPEAGQLQICNIAWDQPGPGDGDGVEVGMRFTFLVNGKPIPVAAGPMPGGNCVTVGTFAAGTSVTVLEEIPEGFIIGALAMREGCELVRTPPDHPLGEGHILGVTCVIPAGVTLDVYFQNEVLPAS